MTEVRKSTLEEWRKENIKVRIYTVNGFQMVGFIKNHDNYVITIADADAGADDESSLHMVYHHAISTIEKASNSKKRG